MNRCVPILIAEDLEYYKKLTPGLDPEKLLEAFIKIYLDMHESHHRDSLSYDSTIIRTFEKKSSPDTDQFIYYREEDSYCIPDELLLFFQKNHYLIPKGLAVNFKKDVGITTIQGTGIKDTYCEETIRDFCQLPRDEPYVYLYVTLLGTDSSSTPYNMSTAIVCNQLRISIEKLNENQKIQKNIVQEFEKLKWRDMCHEDRQKVIRLVQLINNIYNQLSHTNENTENDLKEYDAILEELQSKEFFKKHFTFFQKLRFDIALEKLKNISDEGSIPKDICDFVVLAFENETISQEDLPLATTFLDQTRKYSKNFKSFQTNKNAVDEYYKTARALRKSVMMKNANSQIAHAVYSVFAMAGSALPIILLGVSTWGVGLAVPVFLVCCYYSYKFLSNKEAKFPFWEQKPETDNKTASVEENKSVKEPKTNTNENGLNKPTSEKEQNKLENGSISYDPKFYKSHENDRDRDIPDGVHPKIKFWTSRKT